MRTPTYFDLDKALSLISQLEGGLSKEMKESVELQSSKSLDGHANAAFIKAGGQTSEAERLLRIETRTQHHDLLSTLEELLFQNGFALDLNRAAGNQAVDGRLLRELIEGVSYIRSEGFASIEDFSRLQGFASNLTWVIDFINKCSERTIKRSPEYLSLKEEFDEQRKTIKSIKDRNQKAVLKAQIDGVERKMDGMLSSLIDDENGLEEWLLDGLSKWIDLFNRDQIHFRLQTMDIDSEVEIVCNLKRSCFMDDDVDHLKFSYENRPNVALTLFGLITSVPSIGSGRQYKMRNVKKSVSDRKEFENGFRKAFQSVIDFESFSSFTNYPDVKIYPIAIYRKIETYVKD